MGNAGSFTKRFNDTRVAQLATMWLLALAALAALVAGADSIGPSRCIRIFEPLSKTMRRLEFNGSVSWYAVDGMCKDQFPVGFEGLKRDVLALSEADKALCPPGQPVPLGLHKTGLQPVIWRNTDFFGYHREEVNSTYLARKRGPDTLNNTAQVQVGSFDLATNQWRLVDNTTTFTCAICQRAWVGWLDWVYEKVPARPEPFKYAFTFRLVKTGNDNVTGDEALRLAVDNLNHTLTEKLSKDVGVKFEQLDTDELEGKPPITTGNGTCLRVRSSSDSLVADDVVAALNGSYAVESWRNVDTCPSSRAQGIDWEQENIGSVSKVTLPAFQTASRWCSKRSLPNGDHHAVWDDQVHLWVNHADICRTQLAKNLVGRLQDFAARPAADASLPSLVAMTTEISALEWPFIGLNEAIGIVSKAIYGALAALLVSRESDISASSACEKRACAFVTASEIQEADGPDTLVFTRLEARPSFVDSKVDDVPERFDISVQIPRSASRVALHTVQEGTTEKRVFYPFGRIRTFHFRQSVLVHLTSTTPLEAWRAEGKWPVVFRVNRTGYRHFDFDRFLSVWRLGDGREPTLPCTMFRSEGWIDEFACNDFVGDPRNFTSATFLALAGMSTLITEAIDFLKDHVENLLSGYTDVRVDEAALLLVANLTNMAAGDYHLAGNINASSVHATLDEILSGVVLNGTDVVVVRPHVKFLVSDLTDGVGFSLDELAGVSPVRVIAAGERNNVSGESAIDFVLGANAEQHCKQLAVLTVTDFNGFYPDGSLRGYIKRKLMVFHLVATSRSTPDESSRKAVYLDVQLHRDRAEGEGDMVADDDSKRYLVATWSDRESDWTVSTCGKLRSTRGSKLVFRCQQLAIVGNDFRGRFLIFESYRFAEFLSDTWLSLLIVAGVLSGVSLASIVGTAATQASWRKDMGHKILLHMTTALALNLALGFAGPFVSLDTAGVPCVVVGALRHFSYLAMFAWMLVMSGLQLRRLLSVIGSRATSNLLPKVSSLAWGVPTVVVAALLTFNTGMYRSDVADRGFCYPEGGDFTWSVQVPAATILSLNSVIFVVILARLYGFRGWGVTKDLNRHQNERTFQLRRLKAMFYTFCLFGISWIFHLLAEQGVFQNKFIYEYLFLMTASVHVFSLACIFVFRDKDAQVEWAKFFSSLVARFH